MTKEQNTISYLRLEFAVDPIIRYRMAPFRKSPRPPPSPSRKWFSRVKVSLADRTCRPTRGKCAVTARGEVGGMAWVALWRAFLKQGNVVFWWFLRSYMTSRQSSYWYLLLIEQRIFYILIRLLGDDYSLLCSKKSLRGTRSYIQK